MNNKRQKGKRYQNRQLDFGPARHKYNIRRTEKRVNKIVDYSPISLCCYLEGEPVVIRNSLNSKTLTISLIIGKKIAFDGIN